MPPVDEAELLRIVERHIAVAGRYSRQKDIGKEQAALKADPVFSVFGLTGQEYILAKARGAQMVSLHRKLGDLYQELVCTVFRQTLGLSASDLELELVRPSGAEAGRRTLDAKIEFECVATEARTRVESTSRRIAGENTPKYTSLPPRGLGFELRFCYQIGDAKRINADIENAEDALAMGFLPIMLVFCSISLPDPLDRFRSRSKWFVLEGRPAYDLVRELTGYDLFAFLNRERESIQGWTTRALGLAGGGE
jgi:hypothetical protein